MKHFHKYHFTETKVELNASIITTFSANVMQFIKTINELKLDVFLIDPIILYKMLDHQNRQLLANRDLLPDSLFEDLNTRKQYCQAFGIFTFNFKGDVKELSQVLTDLKFEFHIIDGLDGSQLFHKRHDFLWIGSIPALQEKSHHKLMPKDVHYGQHESAFDFGTLLGWYRQCGVIPYTSDVDTGTWAAFASDQLIDAFIHNDVNLKLSYIYGFIENGLQFALFTEHDFRLDLFFTYKEGPNLTYTGHVTADNAYFRYIYPYFTLCSAELVGVKVLVPCNPVDVISAEYGLQWHLPQTNWSWLESPYNMGPRLNWTNKFQPSYKVLLWDIAIEWRKDIRRLIGRLLNISRRLKIADNAYLVGMTRTLCAPNNCRIDPNKCCEVHSFTTVVCTMTSVIVVHFL
ncbi:unnamed protein product [Medioppia subpectinata]|uniref:Uncharacterized protein n=1 Tax=Medioppia subpectinata TaxID=1979941 RepID=A0A7R9Q2Q2_9ACAR|nr:unnamed protein product [Medioppia subpectinata]CAG2109664.1 unnamed protein product [Medioppia subpectinata]